jgi:uncharacterized repeat protein (TIGR03803 family)
MTPEGAIKRLAIFNGTNGASPQSALIQGTDGAFYGTTYVGGTAGKGTIFRVTASGFLTSLYSFTGGVDGGNPRSALVIGRDGNFYGTAFVGGACGGGTVYRLTPGGTFTLLQSFGSLSSPGAYPNGITLGNDGNFYGTTYWGGSSGGGSVFQLTPSGTFTTLYSFNGTSDGGNPDTSLTLAKDGNFYGTTVGVGFGNFGTVFKISPAGAFSTLHSFTGGSDGAYVAAPLMQASDGNFYGISSLGGTGADGTIFRITPRGDLTTLHQFRGPGISGNVPGAFANFGALVQGSDGNFYGCVPRFFNALLNLDDGAIFRITAAGNFTLLASFISPNGEAPVGVLLDQEGNIFGTDVEGGSRDDGTLFRLTPHGLSTIVNFNGVNGMFPTPLIQGRDGDLYGAYRGSSANPGGLFRRTRRGKLVWQVLFHGTNGTWPTAALFQAKDGDFYGTTSGGGASLNGTVFRLTPSGALTTLYSFTGGVDGAAPQAGLVQDQQGNLYGTSYVGGISGSGTVFKVTTTGMFTSLYSFTGGADGGSPIEGLTLGDDGNLYGVTIGGGSNFAGTVFQITPGGVFTSLYSFSFFNGGSLPYSALVKGANGIFYGATLLGETSGYGSLYSVTTTGTVATVYSFTGGADGGPPISLSPGAGGSLLGTTTGTGISTSDPGTVFRFIP